MKKVIFTLCALLFISTLTYSGGIKVVSNEPIPLPKTETGYNPVLSPAGDYLLITGNDLKGLRKYDLVTKQLQTLTTDKGAGFDVQISENGNLVAYRSQQYKNRLRYTSLKTLDISTGKRNEVVKESRDLEKFIIKDGTVLAVEKGTLKSKRVSGKTLRTAPAISSISKGQLYLTQNKQTIRLSPEGKNINYLWTSISPDGNKLLYYVIEHGKAYVSNLDGSNPVSLGVMRAPKWMGNNWVIGMEDYDDGSVLTASKIIAVAANGSNRTALTADSVIATNPSGSADATKIVYNTADGQIFLMNIEILQ
jgi:Tol biopolymer transport system component